jgi:hypothetical protein
LAIALSDLLLVIERAPSRQRASPSPGASDAAHRNLNEATTTLNSQ